MAEFLDQACEPSRRCEVFYISDGWTLGIYYMDVQCSSFCSLYLLLTGRYGDEPVFADGEVIAFGQIIGVVLASNQSLAQRAAKAVRVTYHDLPSVITIEVRGRGWEGGKELKNWWFIMVLEPLQPLQPWNLE